MKKSIASIALLMMIGTWTSAAQAQVTRQPDAIGVSAGTRGVGILRPQNPAPTVVERRVEVPVYREREVVIQQPPVMVTPPEREVPVRGYW